MQLALYWNIGEHKLHVEPIGDKFHKHQGPPPSCHRLLVKLFTGWLVKPLTVCFGVLIGNILWKLDNNSWPIRTQPHQPLWAYYSIGIWQCMWRPFGIDHQLTDNKKRQHVFAHNPLLDQARITESMSKLAGWPSALQSRLRVYTI